MNEFKKMKRPEIRRHALSAAALALCAGTWMNANAFEFDTGNDDLQVRWDNTVRYNYGYRVQGQDPVILKNINADDGDRNFAPHSTVNNRVDVLSEFDVVYQKKFGARVSGAGWYDNAYSGKLDNTSLATSNHMVNGQPALGLSDYTERYYKGPSGELLDAFVFGSFDLGTMPLSLRAGRHTVNWGEALLGGGAIHGVTYGQAPLDLAKSFASPGIEAKELYRPLGQVSGTLQATSELTFGGQYFFQWDASRFPETGSYLGFNDALQNGGESLLLAPGVRALRGPDLTPKDSGDWGLMSRWSPMWLDGTMGFYVRNFSDKLPQVVVKATAPRQYFLTYGDDIDMYGLSLAKQIAGVSVGADLNYRRNMPLNSDIVQITSTSALPKAGDLLGARGDTVHGVLNAIGSVAATPLFNSATWSSELTWNRWTSVTQGAQYFKGRDNYTAIDKVSKDYFGLAINFTPTWYQVFPGADLSMPLSYSVGLSGNSAVASGGNKNAGSYGVGFGLDLYSKYRFDLKYIGYFGDYTLNAAGAIAVANGTTTYLRDRGAIFLTFKTTL
ncbi:DUF1302 domain-containing protein [Variovorax sp. J22R133]|uniref:DUF1302 domain-containing protein n=1 Tax=Variovorax brevis TaxID=3053503 RepID=UPI002575584E|nr:DUF1302 domain-containing protein [Variovorax sp. J22R133]MDM0117679.1 DUF1302 domain-containing protein [Variovorax sp. J22R133]